MTLPVSARTPVRCEIPDDPQAPVYLIQVPKLIDRADYRRRLNVVAVRHEQPAFLRALRREVANALEGDPARDRTLETIDLFRADPAGADPEIVAEVQRLEDLVRATSENYRQLFADNEFYGEVGRLIAIRRFLLGIEGADGTLVPYPRRDQMIAEDVIEAISDDHLIAIGQAVLDVLQLRPANAKNSASPSPSPAGPATSPAASGPVTAGPDGSSSARSTSETRDTA